MNEQDTERGWAILRRIILMTTLLVGGAGCNEISGANAIEFKDPPDAGTSASSSSGETSSSSATSSSTGGKLPLQAFQLRCNTNGVIQAIWGRAGDWLDTVSIACAERNPDGTLGPSYMLDLIGGSGGQTPYLSKCLQAGAAIVGFSYQHYKGADLAFRVSVECAAASAWPNTSTSATATPYVGGRASDGTISGPFMCKHGQFPAGIEGTADEYVRSFTAVQCITPP